MCILSHKIGENFIEQHGISKTHFTKYTQNEKKIFYLL